MLLGDAGLGTKVETEQRGPPAPLTYTIVHGVRIRPTMSELIPTALGELTQVAYPPRVG